MRHSDIRLTAKTYNTLATNLALTGTPPRVAMEIIDSQNLVRTSPPVSIPVEENVKSSDSQAVNKQHNTHDL